LTVEWPCWNDSQRQKASGYKGSSRD